MTGMRRLGTPKPASVRVGATGVPVAVGGDAVEAVAEEWVVEDRWWTGRPLRRRYFELVLADGRNMVVFRDLRADPAPAGNGFRSPRDDGARSARDGGFPPAGSARTAGSASAGTGSAPTAGSTSAGRWYSQVG